MAGRLEGKIVVVAGAGAIGGALARRYAAEGASVVLGDLKLEYADMVVGEIDPSGRHAVAAEFDGGDDVFVGALVARAVSTFGRLDGFHANYASFIGGTRPTGVDIDLDIFDVMAVDGGLTMRA